MEARQNRHDESTSSNENDGGSGSDDNEENDEEEQEEFRRNMELALKLSMQDAQQKKSEKGTLDTTNGSAETQETSLGWNIEETSINQSSDLPHDGDGGSMQGAPGRSAPRPRHLGDVADSRFGKVIMKDQRTWGQSPPSTPRCSIKSPLQDPGPSRPDPNLSGNPRRSLADAEDDVIADANFYFKLYGIQSSPATRSEEAASSSRAGGPREAAQTPRLDERRPAPVRIYDVVRRPPLRTARQTKLATAEAAVDAILCSDSDDDIESQPLSSGMSALARRRQISDSGGGGASVATGERCHVQSSTLGLRNRICTSRNPPFVAPLNSKFELEQDDTPQAPREDRHVYCARPRPPLSPCSAEAAGEAGGAGTKAHNPGVRCSRETHEQFLSRSKAYWRHLVRKEAMVRDLRRARGGHEKTYKWSDFGWYKPGSNLILSVEHERALGAGQGQQDVPFYLRHLTKGRPSDPPRDRVREVVGHPVQGSQTRSCPLGDLPDIKVPLCRPVLSPPDFDFEAEVVPGLKRRAAAEAERRLTRTLRPSHGAGDSDSDWCPGGGAKRKRVKAAAAPDAGPKRRPVGRVPKAAAAAKKSKVVDVDDDDHQKSRAAGDRTSRNNDSQEYSPDW